MHLAIDTEERTVGVNDGGSVVINTGGAPLEQRRDDDDTMLAREFLECVGAWAGNWLGEFEVFVIFALAKVLRTK